MQKIGDGISEHEDGSVETSEEEKEQCCRTEGTIPNSLTYKQLKSQKERKESVTEKNIHIFEEVVA